MTLISTLNKALLPFSAGVRAESAADLPFAAALYASTRSQELAATSWSPAQKTAFCQQQFDLQHAHYGAHGATARFLIIQPLHHARPIGRLYVNDAVQEIGLMEITLVSASRQRGMGAAIVNAITSLALHTSRTVVLHVEQDSPARKLYDRHGFVDVGAVGSRMQMRWAPKPID